MPNKTELKISDLTVDMLRAENPDLVESNRNRRASPTRKKE